MAEYIVSARKYRPDSFETLIGQDNIARTLKNSILRGQLAHAYLFCGPRGVGKTTTARIFAKAINCSNPSADMEPCGECESCLSFKEGRSYCIHELDAASNNGVEDIKNLMDQVQIPPQVGKYSVYIIDEVHMLTTNAFNAFLKTLEEPPAHAIFILATTEKHKILPTILSRCQTYDFNRISIPDIVRNLKDIAAKESITIDDESLHIIAQKADGAMRDALTIFDQTVAFCGTDIRYQDVIRNLNVLDYEYTFSLVDAFLAGDHKTALLKFDEVLSKGFNAIHFISSLSSHLRDLAVAKTDGLDSLLELPDSIKERYREQASRCSLQFIYNALEITMACESGYKASLNPRLHIEFTLMKLSFLNGMTNVPATKTEPQPAPKPLPQPAPKPEPKPTPKPEPKPEPQPAPEPKPQAEPVKEAAPAPSEPETPRKRVRKSVSSISMTSIMEEKQEKEAATKVQEISGDNAVPENETIAAKWETLPQAYASQPRLANTLANAKIAITEEDGMKTLTFTVLNVAQRDWIREKIIHDLEGRLQKALNSTKVRLDVDVVVAKEVEKRIYLPEEMARDLMSKNGEVEALVKDLGLDTTK